MEARLFISALLFLCVARYAWAGCDQNIYVTESGCSNGHYTAPQISDVVMGTPTKLAKSTNTHGDTLTDSFLMIMSGGLGLLPGGALISGFFNAISNELGIGGESPDKVWSKMYDELVDEIENLRNHMDDRIDETNLDWVKNKFGDANGGLMAVGLSVTEIDGRDLDDLESELDDLYDMLIADYYTFAPSASTTSVAIYERTLPLFRQYADLLITTMVSEIAVFKLICEEDKAAKKATALQERIKVLEQHYIDATAAIIADHTNLGKYSCCYSCMWLGWWIFTELNHYLATCTIDMDGSECSIHYKVGCNAPGFTGTQYDFEAGQASVMAASLLIKRRSTFVSTRSSELSAYWGRELKDAMDKWKELSTASVHMQNAYVK